MALGADLDVDLLLCGTCNKGISAVAGYGCLVIIGMDSVLHDIHLFEIICELLAATPAADFRSMKHSLLFDESSIPGLTLQVPAVFAAGYLKDRTFRLSRNSVIIT